MHDIGLGKGERHAHKTNERLSQHVIPAFHMGSFSRLFPNGGVLLAGDHHCVGHPEVREAMPLAIEVWDGLPQPSSYGRSIPILSTSVNQSVWLAPITIPSGSLPGVGMA